MKALCHEILQWLIPSFSFFNQGIESSEHIIHQTMNDILKEYTGEFTCQVELQSCIALIQNYYIYMYKLSL